MVINHARTRRIRSIFVSDVHLGCKHSRAGALVKFLEAHEPDHLYLVGDFIDGWKLKSVWRWLPDYNRLLHRLIELTNSGTRLYYTPGNHDDFLRKFLFDFGIVEVRDEFIFESADGRRILVTHGDKFDRFEQSARWFTQLLSFVYDAILSANWLVSKLRKPGKRSSYAFSAAIKLCCKRLAMFLSDFEQRLVEHAKRNRCDGIICGHIHKPAITQNEAITYFNTGDWVEHCTALVEYDDGQMELLFMQSDDERGTLTVVNRIAAPRPPQVIDDGWHDEFDDGFNNRLPDDWSDSETEDVPSPAGGTAVASPAKPRNRIRRLLGRLQEWPKAVGASASRSTTDLLRIIKNPRHLWGFFIGLMPNLPIWIPDDTLDCPEPTIETA